MDSLFIGVKYIQITNHINLQILLFNVKSQYHARLRSQLGCAWVSVLFAGGRFCCVVQCAHSHQLLVLVISSPAEEAGRDQPSVSRHVELCYPTLGVGDQRSALCWPVQHGNWHEGQQTYLWLIRLQLSSDHLHANSTINHSFKASRNFFSTVPNVCLFFALRLPWRVWGPLSHLAYRHTFASSWRYAWMKTQQRGLNLTWLCQFWKKCRTNENSPVPSCTEPDILPQMVVWCLPVLP